MDKQEPKLFSELKGIEPEIKLVKAWIRSASYPGFILITGDSGTGKTSLWKMLVRSAHCENRNPDTLEPCGVCDSCKRKLPDDACRENNVLWVTADTTEGSDGKAHTSHKKVSEALMESDKGPILCDDPSREVLFVILDEFHRLPDNLRQSVLTRGDLHRKSRGQVVYVGVTMLPDKLDPTVYSALAHRGALIKLPKPRKSQLVEYITDVLDTENLIDSQESAEILAEQCRNSYRGADSEYNKCKLICNNTTINVDKLSEIYRLPSLEARLGLWVKLANYTKIVDVRDYIITLLDYYDSQTLIEVLSNDLDLFLESEMFEDPDEYNTMQSLLYGALQNPRFSLVGVLIQMRGFKIIERLKEEIG